MHKSFLKAFEDFTCYYQWTDTDRLERVKYFMESKFWKMVESEEANL